MAYPQPPPYEPVFFPASKNATEVVGGNRVVVCQAQAPHDRQAQNIEDITAGVASDESSRDHVEASAPGLDGRQDSRAPTVEDEEEEDDQSSSNDDETEDTNPLTYDEHGITPYEEFLFGSSVDLEAKSHRVQHAKQARTDLGQMYRAMIVKLIDIYAAEEDSLKYRQRVLRTRLAEHDANGTDVLGML